MPETPTLPAWLYPTRTAYLVHYFPEVGAPSLCRRYYAGAVEAMTSGDGNDPRCKTCERKAPADEPADAPQLCDHGPHPVHPDRNGWWVGDDETSDCPDNPYPNRPSGHTVEGSIRT